MDTLASLLPTSSFSCKTCTCLPVANSASYHPTFAGLSLLPQAYRPGFIERASFTHNKLLSVGGHACSFNFNLFVSLSTDVNMFTHYITPNN